MEWGYRADGRKGGKVDAIQGRKLDHTKSMFMQNLRFFAAKNIVIDISKLNT